MKMAGVDIKCSQRGRKFRDWLYTYIVHWHVRNGAVTIRSAWRLERALKKAGAR